MATTPIWVPLVVAVLGLGGVLLTQYRADRRADAERAHQLECEKARWAREDAARSYEYRRAAYADFIKEFRLRLKVTYNDPPQDYLDPLYDCLTQVEIFGTEETASRAVDAVIDLQAHVFAREPISAKVFPRLLRDVRRDLKIQDGPDDLVQGNQ